MADVVVEERSRRATIRSAGTPRRALLKHRFANAADEERPKNRLIGAVKQQIAMKPPVGRQRLVEDQLQDGRRLIGVTKGVELLRSSAKPLGQQPPHAKPNRNTGTLVGRQFEQSVEIGEELCVRRPEEKLRYPRTCSTAVEPAAWFSRIDMPAAPDSAGQNQTNPKAAPGEGLGR